MTSLPSHSADIAGDDQVTEMTNKLRQEQPAGRPRVAIVGAGYAGLSAALNLRGAGAAVTVFEASDRVGGRIRTVNRDGVAIDLGGQWIGASHNRLRSWANRYRCTTFHTWDAGDHIELWVDDSRASFPTGKHPEGRGIDEYEELLRHFDTLARTIPTTDPTASEHLREWDGETVESWLARNVGSEEVRRRVVAAVRAVWACEARDVSMFHFLFYIATTPSMDDIMGTLGWAQDSRFHHGAQCPALGAARELGDAVRLGSQVRRIRQDGGGVVLELADGETVESDYVVVATTPAAALRIEYEPMLPAAKRRWLNASIMRDVAKIHVRYPTPFWRAAGRSGQIISYGDQVVTSTFDNSPDDADVGILVSFVYGDQLRSWSRLDPDARKSTILRFLADSFGPAALEVVDYVEQNWCDDPLADGGYAAIPAPGAWLEHGHEGWRRATGRIHWAGTESASIWNGYMEGAIESGERAAAEILSDAASTPTSA